MHSDRINLTYAYTSNLINLATPLIAIPFFINILSAEEFGIIALFLLMTSILLLLDLGISTSLSRKLSEKLEMKETKYVFESILSIEKTIFLFVILILLFLIALSPYVANTWIKAEQIPPTLIQKYFCLMVFSIVPRLLTLIYQATLIALENHKLLSINRSVVILFRYFGGLLFLFLSGNIEYFFYLQILITLIEIPIIRTIIFLNNQEKLNTNFSISFLKDIVPFGLSLSLTSIIWSLYSQSDKFFLSGTIPLQEFGFFSLITMLSSGLIGLSLPITQILTPKLTKLFSSNKLSDIKRIYMKYTTYSSIFIFSLLVPFIIFPETILYLWTRDSMASEFAAQYLPMYLTGSVFSIFLLFPYYLQFAFGKIRLHIILHIILVLFGIPTIYFLIIYQGIGGAVYYWISSNIVLFIIWPYIVHSRIFSELKNIWYLSFVPSIIGSIVNILFFSNGTIYFDTDIKDLDYAILPFVFIFNIILCFTVLMVSKAFNKKRVIT